VRLELSDDETLAVFGLDALSAIAGEDAHRPEVAILDAMTREAEEALGQPALARWLRAGLPAERPIDLLRAGDFAGFEDALARRLGELG
jgi:hypothetical protein